MRPAWSAMLAAGAVSVAGVAGLPAPLEPPFQHWRTTPGSGHGCNDVVRDVTSFGASPTANATTNQAAINAALAALEPCDTLVIPTGTYSVVGGIEGWNLENVTLVFNGVLEYVEPVGSNLDDWPMSPTEPDKKFADGFALYTCRGCVITSDVRGQFNGNGKIWWDKDLVGDLPPSGSDSRPKLIRLNDCTDLLVERIDLVNSPSWNLDVSAVRAEIREVTITTDRDYSQALKRQHYGNTGSSVKKWLEEKLIDWAVQLLPDWVLQPEDLNTDGFDISGIDLWVHDCQISNDDDSVAVKPSSQGSSIDGVEFNCTQNLLIENMELVGFGASIGSVGPKTNRPCVDAVTFRNVSMPGTGKGIYVKSNGDDCNGGVSSQLSNLRFEDFKISDPFWYSIWIGPQQQNEPGSDLGLQCALIYPLAGSQCPTQGCSDFVNITLKDVSITNPLLSPGAILGNSTNPMQNVVFDNVVVSHDENSRTHAQGRYPWHEAAAPYKGTYQSTFAPGICVECDPVPDGFTYMTRAEYEATK